MPSHERSSPAAVFKVLGGPQAPLGMAPVGLFFAGQFGLFTYLRPLLVTVTRVSVSARSLIPRGVARARLAGTYLIGLLLRTSLYGLLISMPLGMAVVAMGLLAFGSSAAAVTMLLVFWGLIGTAAPVAWWTWMSKVLPDDAEAGGGLMVAVVQLAITIGASLGGFLFDGLRHQATFTASAMLLCS